jgi:hypothetical protein
MAKTVTITRLGTRELWEAFSRAPLQVYTDVAARMNDAGIEDAPTLTRALESVSPSEKGDDLDAFGRMMQEAGIRTRSNPQAGWWASRADAFLQNAATRALLFEFGARNWRNVSMRDVGVRDVTHLSTDYIPGSIMRPWDDGRAPRWSEQMAPAIPLSEIVGVTSPINGNIYRNLYIEWDADEARMARVAQGADIPLAKIATSQTVINLYKYGRGLRATYEALRQMRVDRMAWFFQMLAIQAEMDKVAAALDVMVNGDGNSGSAAEVINLTTLDPDATPPNLTLKAWLAFKMRFAMPYMLTHALMRENVALQLAMLNTGSANVPLSTVNLGGLGTNLVPINSFADGTRYGWTAEAPANVIVGYDRRFAIERATEVGATIQEQDRFILNQTEVVTMTETEGCAVLDRNAAKILNLAA